MYVRIGGRVPCLYLRDEARIKVASLQRREREREKRESSGGRKMDRGKVKERHKWRIK